MKLPCLRSNGAYFPRKISGVYGTLYCNGEEDPLLKGMEVEKRDVRYITPEEKKQHKKAMGGVKRKIEKHEDYLTGLDDDMHGYSFNKKKKNGSSNPDFTSPISFGNL